MGYAISLPNKERHARLEMHAKEDEWMILMLWMQLKIAEILKLVLHQTCVPMVDVASQINEMKEDPTVMEELKQLRQKYQRLEYTTLQSEKGCFKFC